ISRVNETDGHRMIFILRMTPFFPFMTGSLFFGSLKVKFWPFLLVGFLGTVPAKFLQVFAGAVAHESYTTSDGPSGWEGGVFLFSVVVFLVVSWRIGKVTQSLMKKTPVPDSPEGH
ncbi:MAG: VTT domain-containing protein, partial [Kiritimatiellae bacterium]|nr:VTT domain-containing protein [Kiritimatiellia bacterium]